MCSQDHSPNVFPTLSATFLQLSEMFSPNLAEGREFYNEKKIYIYLLSLNRLGRKAWDGGTLLSTTLLPLPSQSTHSLFLLREAVIFILGYLSPWGTSELSFEKIAVSPGNHKSPLPLQVCSCWVKQKIPTAARWICPSGKGLFCGRVSSPTFRRPPYTRKPCWYSMMIYPAYFYFNLIIVHT